MDFRLDIAEGTAQPAQALEVYREMGPALDAVRSALDQSKVDALLRLLGNSNFLARWARRYPEKAAEALVGDLSVPIEPAALFEEFRGVLGAHAPVDRETLAKVLFDRKYRHLFRISLRDVGLGKPFREIVAEFSALARGVVQSALEWHLEELSRDFGRPRCGDGTGENPFSVLAMGKLGGDELNFSSDIDLIYFYGSDEGRVEGPAPLGPHEYFAKLAERLSSFLQKKSHDGFLYRVDLELRPEGKAGTLVNSLDAMEAYYESFGADWEKQAMIRASLCAGDAGLCAEFLRRIHPFVYPKLRDFGFLKRLGEMKAKIHDSIRKRTQQTFHLKLGEGGIREVEFFVQSLQLLFGGQDPALQVPNTLEALPRLREAGLIEAGEEDALRRAYVFLRTMEHRLQLPEEQQAHQLPDSPEELAGLARRMGYAEADPRAAVDHMLSELETHRHVVQTIFRGLLADRFEVAEG
ncbi:hypothetical protein FBR05_13975 [Deltaproteobacteria bacterium PRO3]|nr:hypothetical protein [Deltaproteobacteria bacterium PRO3]